MQQGSLMGFLPRLARKYHGKRVVREVQRAADGQWAGKLWEIGAERELVFRSKLVASPEEAEALLKAEEERRKSEGSP